LFARKPSKYTSAEFARLADDHQVRLSHVRTGQCWDNALAESFFSAIKGELLDDHAWPTRPAARRAITEYIAWYNGTRLRTGLQNSRRIRSHHQKGEPETRSLTSHQPCPSKRGRLSPGFGHDMGLTAVKAADLRVYS
jgi:transposase InsO family protein